MTCTHLVCVLTSGGPHDVDVDGRDCLWRWVHRRWSYGTKMSVNLEYTLVTYLVEFCGWMARIARSATSTAMVDEVEEARESGSECSDLPKRVKSKVEQINF